MSGFEQENISVVKPTLEKALEMYELEIREKFELPDFSFEDRYSRRNPRKQLFDYLVGRRNILRNEDIDVFVADVIYANSKGSEHAEGLFEEAEKLLSERNKNDFLRAYQAYLLAEIELCRVEEGNGNYKNAIQFLEESLYFSRDIQAAKKLMFETCTKAIELSSGEEREVFERKLKNFIELNPEYLEVYEAGIEEGAIKIPVRG